MPEYNNLELTFDEIWLKMDLRLFVLVHMKGTMEPKIMDPASGALFNVPEGYLEFDTKNYFRKF